MKKKLIPEEILIEHHRLMSDVNFHNEQYHKLDKPFISDYEYDQLFLKLLNLEARYPEIDTIQSPTSKAGYTVLNNFTKVAHRKPMLSLANSYDENDLIEFNKKIKKYLLQENEINYFAEVKLDGLSIELIYEKGRLIRALTRGDGAIGEDVTHNILTIKSIPQKISHFDLLEVRGEILIYKNDFLKLNQQQVEKGQTPFANPRNAAAGAVRQLDSKIAAARPLQFIAYALGETQNISFETQADIETQLKNLGFPVIPSDIKLENAAILDVIDYYHKIEKIRGQLDFDIDGIVVKVNSLDLQNELGMIARSPRWATAAKFKPERAETIIENIIIQVGRTGALTPVAIMKPVKVGGVKITNATLHNQDEINRKDIRIGDSIFIQRAGDVIPEITDVIFEKRKSTSVPFLIPKNCPVCQSETVKEEDEVISRCVSITCPAIISESIKHFVSRKAMNMEKIGDKLIDALVEKKIISNFSDLYKLNFEMLTQLDRQGEKSIQNILDSVEKSKKTTLAKFIYSLGIRFVGEQTAKLLADHYLTIDRFLNSQLMDLETIPEIGPKVSTSIMKMISKDEFTKEVKELQKYLQVTETFRTNDGVLSNLSFLITGTLPVGRDEAQQVIEAHSGKILSSVSKKLSYLVVGESPGSKIEKAQSLNVKIITWDELLQKIKK